MCKHRNLFLFPEVSQLQSSGFFQSYLDANLSTRQRQRRRLAKLLNLDFLFWSRTVNLQYFTEGGSRYQVANGPDGSILGVSQVHFVDKYQQKERRFKSFRVTGVNQYESRVARLQFVLHSIVERGLCKEVIHSLKRLWLVAFTCNKRQFLKLTSKVVRMLPMDRLRDPLRLPLKQSYKYPSLTGETKVHSSLNGIEVQKWTYRKVVKPSNVPWD